MNTNLIITGEIATSVTASSAVALAVDASPLITALITFGISIVTVVGGELIKYLVAYFQKKTKDLKEIKEDTKIIKKDGEK